MSRIAAPPGAAQAGRVPCAADPELMFPLDESQRVDQRPTAGERAALAVCRSCRLLEACRAQVLEQPLPYGVAGGLTAAQRRGLRARGTGRAAGQRPEVAA